jgi:light-regulated signal transduction histidine kinase (bacteriophytochrome)
MVKDDLDLCSKEPIHIPGYIQAHGILIIIDSEGIIKYCSENFTQFAGLTVDNILESHISNYSKVFGKSENNNFILDLINLSWQGKNFKPINPYQVEIDGMIYNLILSLSDDHYILDFEQELSDLFSDPQNIVGASLSQMLADKDIDAILRNVVQQVKNIISYDRIMVYQFHDDGHGEVVAEERNEQLETWLGLHYPASDIPEQARNLYKKNLTRLISNVHEQNIPLMSTTDVPADLSNSTLRAVSPVHIQYLKNMGVTSSFSVSIIVDDELWGLIACHNYSPRFINYRQRETAKLIGQVLSSCIGLRNQEKNQKEDMKLQTAVLDVSRSLHNEKIADFIETCSPILLNAFKATGISFLYEGETTSIGTVPELSKIKEISEFLYDAANEVLITENSKIDFPELQLESVDFAGFAGCRLTKDIKDCVIVFRPEIIQTVKWAGDPNKIISHDERGQPFISPRNSFEEWSQQVKGSCLKWSSSEIRAIMEIRDEVNFAVGRKTAELRILNEKLRDAYSELDAFAHTVSHDLKIPLTTIKAFAELIIRKSKEDDIKIMSTKIVDNSDRLNQMIKTVLEYSKVGQKDVRKESIDMSNLINDIVGQLLMSNLNANLNLVVKSTPDLSGDPILIFQVFLNLIENAVKYSHKTEYPVVEIDGQLEKDEVIYTVKDNGVGMSSDQQTKIFGLFNRVGKTNEYEGSGIGLATVKKIINRHGATISVESEEGNGSTFTVKFPRKTGS